ncbi:hypothetical protein ILYODFUR_027325 [Ilyodon furcidens]|uniref:Uncharacterized protein n=1 Tax=Ilyodon furcidens TaxID=33524 RepID=A0ABV0SR03_9TELE
MSASSACHRHHRHLDASAPASTKGQPNSSAPASAKGQPDTSPPASADGQPDTLTSPDQESRHSSLLFPTPLLEILCGFLSELLSVLASSRRFSSHRPAVIITVILC